MLKPTISIMLAGLLAGCAGGPVLTSLPANHPANPDTLAAPYVPPPNVLAEQPAPPPAAAPSSQPHGGGHDMHMGHTKMHHSMKMKGMDMNHMDMHDMNMSPSSHQTSDGTSKVSPPASGHASAASAIFKASGVSGGQVVYTCSMHRNVAATQPGQCPICGMTLIPKTTNGQSGERSKP